MSDDTPILPGLSPVESLPIHAKFDGGAMSSNGGALVLREAGRSRGLSALLASGITDARDPARVVHSHAAMIQARMVAIACGHEDCDDLDVLRHDPALKIACDKRPDADVGLASQPTLSRLENAVTWRMLARMGLGMIDAFCDSYARVPHEIVLDIDDTVDLAHGDQQLSLFSSHAGDTCFQPILIFEASTQKPVAAILRPGKRPSGEEAARVLRHVIRRIRANWPRVDILLRGDGHYGTPEVMDLAEDAGCRYVLGLPTNARLKAIAMPWTEDAATRRALHDKDCLRRFFQTDYAARSWPELACRTPRHRPRRGQARPGCAWGRRDPLHRHQHPRRQGKASLREDLLRPGAHGEHDQGAQNLSRLRPHLLPPLGGQPVPPVPAHRRLLADARPAQRRAPQIPLALRHLRDNTNDLPENRRADRDAEDPHPRLLPQRNAEHPGHRAHALDHRRPRTVTGAATVPQTEPDITNPSTPKIQAPSTAKWRRKSACDQPIRKHS